MSVAVARDTRDAKWSGRFWPSLLSEERTIAAILLLVATMAIRAPWFGDLTYHEDEGFYLAFAEAMHRGAMPYVDIWDRKPFGLFILYGLMSALPGDDVLNYQAVAGLFVFATAFTVYAIARSQTGFGASLLAGLVYIASLTVLLGSGGQSSVFYNLLIALAVFLLIGFQLVQPF